MGALLETGSSTSSEHQSSSNSMSTSACGVSSELSLRTQTIANGAPTTSTSLSGTTNQSSQLVSVNSTQELVMTPLFQFTTPDHFSESLKNSPDMLPVLTYF